MYTSKQSSEIIQKESHMNEQNKTAQAIAEGKCFWCHGKEIVVEGKVVECAFCEVQKLADQYQVPVERVSTARNEYTEAEKAENALSETAMKSQVVFGAQKEVKQVGSLRIAI